MIRLGLGSAVGSTRHVAVLPTTTPGWWSVGLLAAHVLLVLAWSVVPGGAIAGFVCGLVGGGVALTAIRRSGERAVLVFAAIVPLVLVVLFVIGELLIGHE